MAAADYQYLVSRMSGTPLSIVHGAVERIEHLAPKRTTVHSMHGQSAR